MRTILKEAWVSTLSTNVGNVTVVVTLRDVVAGLAMFAYFPFVASPGEWFRLSWNLTLLPGQELEARADGNPLNGYIITGSGSELLITP